MSILHACSDKKFSLKKKETAAQIKAELEKVHGGFIIVENCLLLD